MDNQDTPQEVIQAMTSQERPRLRSRRFPIVDVIEIILLVLITYTPINLMTARAVVEGPSMQPNFYTGQLVIVNRAAYFFSAPQRGDVVVLHNPRTPNGDDLIKRIIGMPGEHIEMRGGRMYINGTRIDEPYVNAFCESCTDNSWQLAPDEYFIMGDNRPNSYDSHNFGPIKGSLIVGEAWIRYWPLPEFSVIPHPAYDTLKNPSGSGSKPADLAPLPTITPHVDSSIY